MWFCPHEPVQWSKQSEKKKKKRRNAASKIWKQQTQFDWVCSWAIKTERRLAPGWAQLCSELKVLNPAVPKDQKYIYIKKT